MLDRAFGLAKENLRSLLSIAPITTSSLAAESLQETRIRTGGLDYPQFAFAQRNDLIFVEDARISLSGN